MKQDNKKEKKSKKYHKPHRKMSWIDKVKQHSKTASLLDRSIFFFSAFGIIYLLFGTTLIPKPYQTINYLFPLFLNLIFLVNMLYQSVFRDNFDGMLTVQDFADPFLYLNGVGLLFHLFFGIMGRNRKSIPPLLTLDHRYIWFPIATYLIFFSLASIITLVMKYIEKKRS